MDKLSADIETYSSVPIAKAGAYKYIQSPDFEILLCAFSLNRAPVQVVDLAQGEPLPKWFLEALIDPEVTKGAYNAMFEWLSFSRHLGRELPIEQWRCTMIHGLYAGFPAGLSAVGKALGLPEDAQKLRTGKALINYFCVPCRPTKTNGGRTRNYPKHDPQKWELFKEYNAQDVVTEMAVEDALRGIPVPEAVQHEWETDMRINARGVGVDMDLVRGALDLGNRVRTSLLNEAGEISGLDNPNSIAQLSEWLEEETGEEVVDLRKDTVARMLGRDGNSAEVQRMLEIRQELGKTSTKKYDAIEAAVCGDGRVRGLLQFYGANRTGRWAGRLVQVQNLPRTYTEPLDLARDLIKQRKLDHLRILFGSVPDTLSQLIRTAFVAAPGNVLIDADFSAIEARVISWLAGEEWRLEVFRTHGKIYEASASQMFGVPIEMIKKGNPEYSLRQRGKVAELALGYQGGVSAMRAMDVGGLLADLPDEEVQEIVQRWRLTNPRICALWSSVENAAVQAIKTGFAYVPIPGTENMLQFFRYLDNRDDYLAIILPSGRALFYVHPEIGVNRWGRPSITYRGNNQKTKKWETLETYGGKLTENIVQAVARDCLSAAILNLEQNGLPVVFHIHDEVVIDVKPFDEPNKMLAIVEKLMTVPLPWALGLPLNADGWVGEFFKKD